MANKNIIEKIAIMMMDNNIDGIADEKILKEIEKVDNLEDVDRDGRTLFINAAFYGRIKILDFLIKKGVNVYAKDEFGFDALHAAVTSKNIETVEFLLSKDFPTNNQNAFGNTPLMCASHQNIDIIKLLLLHGADCTIENNFGVSPLTVFEGYSDIIAIFTETLKQRKER